MSDDELAQEHPRPILARSGWTDLCGPWQFLTDDEGRGVAEGWHQRASLSDQSIVVPYPPESPASGIGDRGFHPTVWYQRALQAARPAAGRRAILHFGAVDWRADIWLNGEHLLTHEGGNTSFRVDITDTMRGSQQTLTVRAEDDPRDLEQPRGKQDWQASPHVIWYERTTGIWQPVWLEEVPDEHVTAVRTVPVTPLGRLEVEVRMDRATSAPVAVELSLSLAGRPLARQSHWVSGDTLLTTLHVDEPAYTAEPGGLAWTPEHPTLCDLEVVVAPGTPQEDRVSSYVGFRTVSADDRHVLLNGLPYHLRLVLSQGYWPETHLAAPSNRALHDEVELIKSLGFNGVRVHQKVEDPRFLTWCDRLGLLVIADAAASYSFTSRSLARTTREWIETVERDLPHPCIVGWTAFNESWGVPHLADQRPQQDAVRAIFHLLKALDPSRLVIGNDGWEWVCGDFLGVHDYTQDPALLDSRYGTLAAAQETVRSGRPGGRVLALDRGGDVPVVLTEFGGLTFAPLDSATWDGYGSAGSSNELHERLAAMLAVVNRASGLAGFCYTQLTDTVQERNGLLTESRKPKLDPSVIRAIVHGGEPVITPES